MEYDKVRRVGKAGQINKEEIAPSRLKNEETQQQLAVCSACKHVSN